MSDTEHRTPERPPAGLVAAQDLARELVRRVEPLIVEGVTELELEQHVLRLGRELGSDAPWTSPTTRIGIGTTVCHPAFPMQDRAASVGDTVIIDVNPVLDGWLGDYCESFVIGDDRDAAGLVSVVREVQLAMIAGVVPGMPASELYALGAALVAERDLKVLDLLDNFGHSQDSAFAAEGFIDATNHTPMWGGWTVEPQLGRHGRGAKFEEIIWLAPGRSPVVV